MAMTRLDSGKRRQAIVRTAVPLYGALIAAGDMAPGHALQPAAD